jgi:RNase P subunit RPR2
MMPIIETIAAKKEKIQQQQSIDLQNIKTQSDATAQKTDRLIYLQKIRFLLCQSCFWCASLIIMSGCSSNVLTSSTLIIKCPSCKNDKRVITNFTQ